jgi:hypothetical protein
MIEAGALPGRISVSALVERAACLAKPNPEIRADISVDPDDLAAVQAMLTKYPLKLLGETKWFRSGPSVFETTLDDNGDTAVTNLAAELVDWRLLRYLKTRSVTYEQQATSPLAEAAEAPSEFLSSPATAPPNLGRIPS